MHMYFRLRVILGGVLDSASRSTLESEDKKSGLLWRITEKSSRYIGSLFDICLTFGLFGVSLRKQVDCDEIPTTLKLPHRQREVRKFLLLMSCWSKPRES